MKNCFEDQTSKIPSVVDRGNGARSVKQNPFQFQGIDLAHCDERYKNSRRGILEGLSDNNLVQEFKTRNPRRIKSLQTKDMNVKHRNNLVA